MRTNYTVLVSFHRFSAAFQVFPVLLSDAYRAALSYWYVLITATFGGESDLHTTEWNFGFRMCSGSSGELKPPTNPARAHKVVFRSWVQHKLKSKQIALSNILRCVN